jgi:hypothetical protein
LRQGGEAAHETDKGALHNAFFVGIKTWLFRSQQKEIQLWPKILELSGPITHLTHGGDA